MPPGAPCCQAALPSLISTRNPGASRGTSTVRVTFSGVGDRDREKPGKGRVHHPRLAAVDDPAVAGTLGARPEARVGDVASVIMNPERDIATRLIACKREMIALVRKKCRQESLALVRRHQAIKQNMRQRPGLGEHCGHIGITGGELLTHYAAGERIGTRAACVFGKRKRAQSELRGLIEEIGQERTLARLQPIGLERSWLDLARHKIPDGLAHVTLLGTKAKAVHCASPDWVIPAGCPRS